MGKVFYFYVVYAKNPEVSDAFKPEVFPRFFFSEREARDAFKWEELRKSVQQRINANEESVDDYMVAGYMDSYVCEAFGIPDNGLKIEDVVSNLFKDWFMAKQGLMEYPIA